MSMRYKASIITATYNPLLVASAPTIGIASKGDTTASITFTAPTNVGGGSITSYVMSSSSGASGTGTTSPIVVTGLTNDVAVTFKVAAVNAYGAGTQSSSSNSVTPSSPIYSLFDWGWNNYGQLGQGDITDRSSPVQVGALTTWLNIAGGTYHTIATKTDGTLWSWGRNNYGQLGQGDITYRSSPVQVGALTTWSKIAGAYGSTIAIASA